MSDNSQTSLIPPGAPIPDPPGANLLAKIPVFFVGLILLVYLVYNISLEVIDWKNSLNPKELAVSENEIESENESKDTLPLSGNFTHPLTNDTRRCFECHESTFSEEMLKIVPGPFWGDQACMVCHPLEDFDEQHPGHEFETPEKCTMCHSPHNSVEKPLLKKRDEE